MRIISGEHKGRRITPPGNLPVRPTTDMAREALFNLLRSRVDIEGIQAIDLFSGTGFISYEFCSRGAASVTAVELHPACVAFIRKSKETLGLQVLSVVRADVFRFLKNPLVHADLVFADPPYDLPNLEEIPGLVLDSGILRPDGLFIMEHGPRHSFANHPNFHEVRHYGRVHFSFFRE